MSDFGEVLAGLASAACVVMFVLGCFAIFGVWKLIELICWAYQHIDINFNWVT